MRLRIAVPEAHVTPEILDAALEASTKLDEQMLKRRAVPTFAEANAAGRVRWSPEPPGDERFDHAAAVMGRGWGDCDDLAPWHAASLRVTGEDPGARAVVYPSGPSRWHAVVRRSSGDMEDPSKAAGMGHGVSGIHPAVSTPMFRNHRRPAVAARRVGGHWEARADVPWSRSDIALSALERSPVAATALVGAIQGACTVARIVGASEDDHVACLNAVSGLLQGCDPHSLANTLGWDAVQSAYPLAAAIARRAPQVMSSL